MVSLDFSNIPLSNLFVLFLIIASNYMGELFPCRVQAILQSDMYLKHLIAFLTLMFFVVLTDSSSKTKKFIDIFTSSFKLYILWLLFINCQKDFFIFGLLLLGTLYILQLIKNDYVNNKIDDKQVNDENKKAIELINKIEKILILLFFVVLVLGFIVYMGQKKLEYKGNFDYMKFIFGNSNCKGGTIQKVNILDSLTSAFK